MTLTSEEHDVIMAMRHKTGKHLYFDENGNETSVKPASAPAETNKPKRTLTDEHKAKLKAGREAKKTTKVVTSAETTLSIPSSDISSFTPVSVPLGQVKEKDLWTKTNQELRDYYHPLVGKKVGMRTSAGLPDKLALITEIVRLHAAGHTPENPAKTAKAE